MTQHETSEGSEWNKDRKEERRSDSIYRVGHKPPEKRERERLLTSLKQLSQKEETTEIEDRGLLPDTARLCTPQAQPYANLSYANEVPCAAVSR